MLIFISDLLLSIMPRSNKKKHSEQRAVPKGDTTVALLLSKESTLMVNRAMVKYSISWVRILNFSFYFQASAHRHQINLRHGTLNLGTGDCAFEAIISNINDRSCFGENMTMSIDWYRRIFVTDMANTILASYDYLVSFEFLLPYKWPILGHFGPKKT